MELAAALFFTDYSMPTVELAQALEARGYESMWAPEHSHIPTLRSSPFPAGGELPKEYSECLDPFVVLSMAGAVTKRLKLGTGVCLVVQRDPIQTAKLVASLDQATDGRFLFGVGNGWNAEEMANHGTTDFKGRHRLVRERIEAMKAIWTQEVSSYSGDLVRFEDITARPKPTQKPYPPIIVGGAFPYGARRAIAYGDGWIPHASRQHYGDVSEFLPQFRQLALEAGRDPGELPVTIWGSNIEMDDVKRMRDRGVSRVVIQLKTAGRDTVLPILDRFAPLIPELKSGASS